MQVCSLAATSKDFPHSQACLHFRGKHLPWYEETMFVTSKAETDRYRYGDLAVRKKGLAVVGNASVA
jgi:hypothetical protein